MTAFRSLLIIMIAAILIYTGITIWSHGVNLLPHFFGAMREMTWQGQFNLDFMLMLCLSGLWTAWRNGFTGAAIALGLVAFFLGILFLATYLLFLSYRTNGDLKQMLLGVHDVE